MLIVEAHVLVPALELLLAFQALFNQGLLHVVYSLNQAHYGFLNVDVCYS